MPVGLSNPSAAQFNYRKREMSLPNYNDVVGVYQNKYAYAQRTSNNLPSSTPMPELSELSELPN